MARKGKSTEEIIAVLREAELQIAHPDLGDASVGARMRAFRARLDQPEHAGIDVGQQPYAPPAAVIVS